LAPVRHADDNFYKVDQLCEECAGSSNGGDNALALMWTAAFLLGLGVGLTLMLALYKGLGKLIWEKLSWIFLGVTRFIMERAAEKAARAKAERTKRAKEVAAKAAAEGATAAAPAPPATAPPTAPHGAAVKFAVGAVIKFITVDLVGSAWSKWPSWERHSSPPPPL